MVRFSVVSVWTDRELLESMLLDSFESEDDDLYELILVDNRTNRFGSAAEALNHGAEQASGEYLIFVHQDVKFLRNDFLNRLDEFVSEYDFGVAGITGATTDVIDGKHTRGQIQHGPSRDQWSAGVEIDEPIRVQTLDELCIIIPAQIFERDQFDASTCPGWHLYGVEYALRMNNHRDLPVYILPIDVWHGSKGRTIDSSYFESLSRVVAKYDGVGTVYTTCGFWPGNRLFASLITVVGTVVENQLNSSLADWLEEGFINKYNFILWYFFTVNLREFWTEFVLERL